MFILYFSRDKGDYEIVQPGTVSPELPVPKHINKPKYYHEYQTPDLLTSRKPEIKLAHKISAMRESCRLAANILEKCSEILKVRSKESKTFYFLRNVLKMNENLIL